MSLTLGFMTAKTFCLEETTNAAFSFPSGHVDIRYVIHSRKEAQ